MPKTSTASVKAQLHSRNRHRHGYNFPQLVKILPELAPFVRENQYGNLSIDFADPRAVKMLNKALLLHFYQLTYWDIPDNYLCPPVPGRADYIHYLADLLAQDNQGKLLQGKQVKVMDIGVGANVIYPIIGHGEYGWSFVGTDIDATALKVAKLIANSNVGLKHALRCRLQSDKQAIFKHIIEPNEYFTLTMCNPPFYASKQEAQANNRKKVQNLTKSVKQPMPITRNFAGQDNELWCEGGEGEFICNMIVESKQYQRQCLWFSSLVAKKETLTILTKQLKVVGATQVKIINMAQGQKISRLIAWTFIDEDKRPQFLVDHRMI